MTAGFSYNGSELELFATATVWKRYVRSRIKPYLGEDVLEVGAGLGGTTRVFCRGKERRWVCLEPDATLADRLARAIQSGDLPSCCEARVGAMASLDPADRFDTILYIDVLEHIEDDRAEVALAARHVRPGGHLIALSPAHSWLFSPFDAAVGHHRRYTRAGFESLAPANLATVRLIYLDSVGILASLSNRFLLKSAMPGAFPFAVWDRVLVRLSRCVDPLLGGTVGKSVLAVWRKKSGGDPEEMDLSPTITALSAGPVGAKG